MKPAGRFALMNRPSPPIGRRSAWGRDETAANLTATGRYEPIVLKNSFLAADQNFAVPWSQQNKKNVGAQQVLRKIR